MRRYGALCGLWLVLAAQSVALAAPATEAPAISLSLRSSLDEASGELSLSAELRPAERWPAGTTGLAIQLEARRTPTVERHLSLGWAVAPGRFDIHLRLDRLRLVPDDYVVTGAVVTREDERVEVPLEHIDAPRPLVHLVPPPPLSIEQLEVTPSDVGPQEQPVLRFRLVGLDDASVPADVVVAWGPLGGRRYVLTTRVAPPAVAIPLGVMAEEAGERRWALYDVVVTGRRGERASWSGGPRAFTVRPGKDRPTRITGVFLEPSRCRPGEQIDVLVGLRSGREGTSSASAWSATSVAAIRFADGRDLTFPVTWLGPPWPARAELLLPDDVPLGELRLSSLTLDGARWRPASGEAREAGLGTIVAGPRAEERAP